MAFLLQLVRRLWDRGESDDVTPGEQYAEWERFEGVHRDQPGGADEDPVPPGREPLR